MAFWIFIVVVGLYVAAAGYTDLRMQRIPNYLTVPAAIGGLIFSLAYSFPTYAFGYPAQTFGSPPDVCNCLLGFALGFAIFFIPFALGGGGSGDLKLVAALGAWLGWFQLLLALALSLSFAMVLALVVWMTSFSARGLKAMKAITPAQSGSSPSSARPKARRRRAVPFAIPMALGTFCILGAMVVKNLH